MKCIRISNTLVFNMLKISHANKDFIELKKMLLTNAWPEAVDNELICSSEEENKFERADGILDYLNTPLSGASFLDFGCGEGHVAVRASKIAKQAIGYDIVESGNFTTPLLTTNFEKIRSKMPYDIILLYDVLDHALNPIETLKQVASLSNKETKIFIRCHPWTSRHAIHAHKELNKAFIHLIFTEYELNELKVKSPFTQKLFFPLETSKTWFEQTGFNVLSQQSLTSPVEDFFKNNSIIKKRLPINIYNCFPEWQMSLLFNDFVVRLK